MSEPSTRKARSRDPAYVKILHVSDLHFHAGSDLAGAPWTNLLEAAGKIQPDLVVVTGDVADNPLSDYLRSRRRSLVTRAGLQFKALWRRPARHAGPSALESVLSTGLGYLQALCQAAGLDPATRLLVIPGNHDYRVQGLFRGKQDAIAAFRKVFDAYSQAVRFEWSAGDTDACMLAMPIYCLDSNGPDEFSNFAAGAVTNEELLRIPTQEANAGDAPQFRIALLHHHPMPIAELEGQPRTSWGRLKGLTEDDRFLMLRNAGTVMHRFADARIHLVLHGHRHKRGFAQVAFPQDAAAGRPAHRVTIVAAGSAGVSASTATNQGQTFNVVTIRPPGYIDVQEWVLVGSTFQANAGPTLLDEEWVRTERYRQAREHTASDQYGEADVIEQYHTVSPTGDAVTRRLLHKLRPIQDGKSTLARLPVGFGSASAYFNPHRQLTVSAGDRAGVTFKPLAAAATQSVKLTSLPSTAGEIVFDPPLSQDEQIDLTITCTLLNAHEMVREFRLARDPTSNGCEFVTYDVRRTPCRKLVRVVERPVALDAAGCEWQADVLSANNRSDERERRSVHMATQRLADKGLYIVTVIDPIPGFDYKIHWGLPPIATLQAGLSGVPALECQQLGAALSDPAHTAALLGVLADTRAALASNLRAAAQTSAMDPDTVLAFMRFDESSCTLERIGDSAGKRDAWSVGPGDGIPGQALRRRSAVLYSRFGAGGDQVYYRRPAYLAEDHTFQYAVPVPYPPVAAAGKYNPLLGMLVIEALKPDRSLVETQSLGGDGAVRAAVAHWLPQEFLRRFAAASATSIDSRAWQ